MTSLSSRWRRSASLLAMAVALATGAHGQTAFAWGYAGFNPSGIPAEIQASGARAVSGGYLASYAVKPDGGVVAWGDNTYGGLNIPAAALSGVSAISAGTFHGLALKEGGVLAWGWDGYGETVVPDEALSGVTAVAAGEQYSLALKNGAVLGWGSNDYGGLNIPAGAGSGVTAIAASSFHALAVKDGGVLAWGNAGGYVLNVPEAAQSGVVAIAAGFDHSLALRSDGSVVAWGSNQFEKCDVPANALTGVVAIAAGYQHSWALKQDGTLVGWGYNVYGDLNPPASAHHLTAIASGFMNSNSLAIRAAAWATLDQTELVAGASGSGAVNIGNPAGFGGVTVDLTSDSAGVQVPATVTVPEGATSASFTFTTDSMFGAPVVVSLAALLNGPPSIPATFVLKGTAVALSLSRTSVIGGSTAKVLGTVTLGSAAESPLTVFLTSSEPFASVPSSVVIPEGATTATFQVSHNLVSSTQTVSLGASYFGSASSSTPLSVIQIGGSVLFEMTTITSGGSIGGYVYLNTPLKTTISLPLSSTLPASVSLPASVTIYAGSRIGSFSISSSPIGEKKTVTITGSVGGNNLSGNLVLLPVPWVSRVTIPATIYGNTVVNGTVRLLQAAPAGGATVNVSAGAGLSVPVAVTIPAGQIAATFQAMASDISVDTALTVTASNTASSATANTTLKPIAPKLLTLSETSVSGGTTVTGTLTLNAAVAVDTVVSLSAGNARASVPASVTILAGSNVATFTITTSPYTGTSTSVLIKATKNGKLASARLTIVP